jgi:hypothetical protein
VLIVERLEGATGSADETDLPNTHCRSLVNRHGIAIRRCFDTIARSTSARFDVEESAGRRLSFRAMARGPSGGRALTTVIDSVRAAR